MMKKVKKAIIPAAGMGTRFLPVTKAQPKEMLPIVDKPTIQYIIEEAIASGIEEILIVTGRNKRAIEDHFDRSVELELMLEQQGKYDLLEKIRKISDIPIHYIRQKEALGLGHAVFSARQFVGEEPFAVLLGDDIVYSQEPCLKQLIGVYEEFGASVLGVQQVEKKMVTSYGIVTPKEVGQGLWQVENLVEKPSLAEAPSNLAILGRYIIDSAIFPILAETKPGSGGEIQLTDALNKLAQSKKMYAYEFSGKRYDIGSKEGFLEATVEFALKDPKLKTSFSQYLFAVADRLKQID